MEKLSSKQRIGASESMRLPCQISATKFAGNPLVSQKRAAPKFHSICAGVQIWEREDPRKSLNDISLRIKDKYSQEKRRYLCEKLQDATDNQKKKNTCPG